MLRHEFDQDLGVIFEKNQNFKYSKYEGSSYRSRGIYLSQNSIKVGNININTKNIYKSNEK